MIGQIKLFAGRTAPSVVTLSLVLLAGCDFPGRPNPANRPVPADEVLDFNVLFSQNCAGCHGSGGKMGPAPPLNDPLFRTIVPEESLKEIITRGRHKTLMPGFARDSGGSLTEAQINVLVKEIKGIPYRVVEKQEAGLTKVEIVADTRGTTPTWGLPQWGAGQRQIQLPAYREEPAESLSQLGDKERGTAVFTRTCMVCHGNQGQGIVQGAETVNTINDRVFLGLVSDQALRRYVITGLPDRGMPGFADARPDNANFVPLTDREVTDVVALLSSWRNTK